MHRCKWGLLSSPIPVSLVHIKKLQHQRNASTREMQLTMASLGRWHGLHIDFQDSFWDPSSTRPTIAAAKDVYHVCACSHAHAYARETSTGECPSPESG